MAGALGGLDEITLQLHLPRIERGHQERGIDIF
jgi:hypothetical protein